MKFTIYLFPVLLLFWLLPFDAIHNFFQGISSKIRFHCTFICISSMVKPQSGTHAIKPNFLQGEGSSLNLTLELKHKIDLCKKSTLRHTCSANYSVLVIFVPNIWGHPRPLLFSLFCIIWLKMREIMTKYLLHKAQDYEKKSQK